MAKIIGITGGSGSGKSTVVKRIKERYPNAVLIEMDNYYKSATFVNNSNISETRLRELMMKTGELAQDIGTIVIGKDAVDCGLIEYVGGVGDAVNKLKGLIEQRKNNSEVLS